MRDFRITVEKTDLIEKLKDNRAAHRATYEEAFEGYRTKMIAELEKKLAKIRAGDSVDPYLRFTAPEDHTDDYDDVIDMLEMDIGPEVELDQTQFRCYVKDDWGWSSAFAASTAAYLS